RIGRFVIVVSMLRLIVVPLMRCGRDEPSAICDRRVSLAGEAGEGGAAPGVDLADRDPHLRDHPRALPRRQAADQLGQVGQQGGDPRVVLRRRRLVHRADHEAHRL
ncbi:hypothetical protein RZS08_05175, partial [Arthrospira platensis SPKY1]|nr:hypothetical protein [Arthrospira platensis SPKY1]